MMTKRTAIIPTVKGPVGTTRNRSSVLPPQYSWLSLPIPKGSPCSHTLHGSSFRYEPERVRDMVPADRSCTYGIWQSQKTSLMLLPC